tara:strand:+ start:987 stop:1802 length:816 start_codon:yes stop_codon:yes gene_type:complete
MRLIKKTIKKLLIKFLNLFNVIAHRSINKILIFEFIKLFKIEIPSNLKLIRIGPNEDGGYLMPDILDEIEFCFSAGIGKNIQFEKDLLNYDIKSFGADNTISSLPENIPNYDFIKKNINVWNDDNNITFKDWIDDKKPDNNNLIGQIDIEGDEYKLILNTPNETFKRFKILIFEFHNIQKISDRVILNYYSSSIQKLLINFNICHIHINNAESFTKVNNIEIPHLLEITFLRKDFYKKELKKNIIPHPLDKKNILDKEEINFDNNWKKIIL